jgi:hypothetical protein
MRPPQPEAAPSGADDCHTDSWSLCESGATHCALVVGCTSLPTFSSTAICWPVNSGSSGANLGASAYSSAL